MTLEQQKAFQSGLLKYSCMKTVQIICAMSFFEKESGINEIAKLTGLPASSVHRILQEMTECSFASKNGKKYRLGSDALTLFRELNVNDFILEAANLEMIRLNDLTRETIHLITRGDLEAVYIGKLEAKSQIGLRSRVGKHIPMYCTSGGKLLMAYQSQEWLDLYFATVPLTPLTDTTITDRAQLLEELERIRRQGFAMDNSEHNPEVVCVAAPVFFSDGRIACSIGVATPKYRIDPDKMRIFTAEVVESAKRITQKLA